VVSTRQQIASPPSRSPTTTPRFSLLAGTSLFDGQLLQLFSAAREPSYVK
jgi:hypothetical protein